MKFRQQYFQKFRLRILFDRILLLIFQRTLQKRKKKKKLANYEHNVYEITLLSQLLPIKYYDISPCVQTMTEWELHMYILTKQCTKIRMLYTIQIVYTCGNNTAVYIYIHSYSDIQLHNHIVLTKPQSVLVTGGGKLGKGRDIRQYKKQQF